MDPHVAANRALWDEWTPIHMRSAFYDVEAWKAGRGRDHLPSLLVEEVGDVAGKDLLNWLPDVPRWAEVVAHFVRSGGFFYIAEAHPFALVLDDDDAATELRLRDRYWPSPEPLEFPNDGSYADPDVPVEEVETGRGVWRLPEPDDQKLPLLFSLRATKP
jgi:hypothetical protein